MAWRLCIEASRIRNVSAEKKHQRPLKHPQTSSLASTPLHPLSIYPSHVTNTIATLSSPYMAATLSNISATSTGAPEGWSSVGATAIPQRSFLFPSRVGLIKKATGFRAVRSAPSTPGGISDKVSESIKKAEEACDGDVKGGECAAAWDEVEELSAAASHARDRAKEYDPLENYCKDNPETNECRTFDS